MEKETRITMRLSYAFKFGDQKYKGNNVFIGYTINPRWYFKDGGKGGRYHKWSAILNELPALYSEINKALAEHYFNYRNPSEFGFKFTRMEKGDCVLD